MLGYFIGIIGCVVLLLLAIKLVNVLGARLNETAGWRTDTLIIGFLLFLVIDGVCLFYCVAKIISLFSK